MICHQPLELLAAVLAAAVGVMQQRIGFAPSPDGHHQSTGDELYGHSSTYRPADHATREQIDGGSDIEPAFRYPDLGEVCHPFAIGCGRLEAAVELVGSEGGRLPLSHQAAGDAVVDGL